MTAADGLFSLQSIWSPEGDQVVFKRGDQRLFPHGPGDPNVSDLWSVNVDGSQLYEITDTPAGYGGVAWLP